jgi:glucose/arabinose dehydrogenase
VLRLKKAAGGEQFAFDAEIFDGIPSGDPANHDGGRIAFGPDGKLYVTTGDQHQPSRPQDLGSLNGKILRLNAPGDGTDGTPPGDNPFVGDARPNARVVWSYGHRHPQGLAWDEQGRLWETEHGPSGESHAPVGAKSGRDELNLVVKGGNYGWPLVAGDQTRACTIPPRCTPDRPRRGHPADSPSRGSTGCSMHLRSTERTSTSSSPTATGSPGTASSSAAPLQTACGPQPPMTPASG